MVQQIFSSEILPAIIDISALSPKVTEKEVAKLAQVANEHSFIAAFVLPAHIAYLKERLGGDTRVKLGAPIGFPTGGDLTQDKVYQVKEMKALGCGEFDMVMAVGKLKSGNTEYVRDEIARVIEAADGYPVKVILEVTYLTDDEIKAASEIVAISGADYVKTGTGYSPLPTEVRHVEIMKSIVGDRVKIKVAGGVRDLESLKAFYGAGARRFGIGMDAALSILEQA